MNMALHSEPKLNNTSGDLTKTEGIMIPLGVFSDALINILVATYAMYYFTDVVGFNPVSVGTFFLIARIWNAISDPMMGVIADKTKTRWGKLKPYLLFAPIFVGVFGYLLFIMPDISMTSKFIYAGTIYVLFDLAYTVIDIPMWAAPAVVTRDNNKINSLISRIQLFSALGSVVASVVTIMLVQNLGGVQGGGFANTAIIYGAACFVLTTLAGVTMKERIVSKKDKPGITLKEIYTVVIKNKYLVIGMITLCLVGTVFQFKAIVATYFVEYNIGDLSLLPVVMLAVLVPGLIGMAFVPQILKKFGTRVTSFGTMIISLVITIIAYFVGYNNLLLVLILHGLFGFFTMISMVVFTIIFADAVIYGEWKHGNRAEATIFAFRTLTGKVSNALAPFILGLLLVEFGYVANSTQTPATLEGLQFAITIIPGILIALCLIPLFYYQLNSKKIAEMQEQINNRLLV